MLLEITRVTNDAEHSEALKRIDALWSREDEASQDELNILALMVAEFEAKHAPTDDYLDPVDIIHGAIEHAGQTRAHLVELLGSASRASEILNRKRALTLDMIRTISEAWGIPISLLTRPQRRAEG